jgi:hypothetical protein
MGVMIIRAAKNDSSCGRCASLLSKDSNFCFLVLMNFGGARTYVEVNSLNVQETIECDPL